MIAAMAAGIPVMVAMPVAVLMAMPAAVADLLDVRLYGGRIPQQHLAGRR
jgi:hypothetical protein